jgi:hypothetical protein
MVSEWLKVRDYIVVYGSDTGRVSGWPDDRVIDGCDQSAFVTGRQKHSNRNYFPMFFDHLEIGK